MLVAQQTITSSMQRACDGRMRGGTVAGLIMTEDEREGMDTLLLELRMEADRACPARLVGGEPGVGIWTQVDRG